MYVLIIFAVLFVLLLVFISVFGNYVNRKSYDKMMNNKNK